MRNHTFLYFATVDSTGEKFSFMTPALLNVGMIIQNDADLAAHITDIVVDFPISCAELKVDYELTRTMSL